MEQPQQYELAPIWDNSITGSGFIHCATMPARFSVFRYVFVTLVFYQSPFYLTASSKRKSLNLEPVALI